MRYSFVAFDSAGKRTSDVIEAATEIAAKDTLAERGLFVVEIDADAGGGGGGAKLGGRKQSKWRCLAEFTRQMAILVSTGTPVVQALGAVERQVTDPKFVKVVGDVRRRVEEGSSLGEAIARHPKYFDAVARSLISAGESSGRLDAMLERLAAVNRQQEVVRRSLTSALAYPILLTTISLLVLVNMLMFVVPRFAVLFESLDTPVPPSTAVLMTLSAHLRAHWWWEIPGFLVGVCGLVVWGISPVGRRMLDALILRMPGFSKLCVSLAMARIARLLGVLLESRVPLLDSLTLVEQSLANEGFRRLIERVRLAVVRGNTISSVVGKSPLVTPAFAEAVRSGEESGKIGTVLTSLADYLDEDNNVMLKSVTQMLEPIVLMILGLVVGTIAVSMFLPLFDATAATGASGGAP